MQDPKPIRTEQDYTEAMQRIEEIFDSAPGTPEGYELELRTYLVEMYERERYPIPAPDPIAAIEFRMEQQGLMPRDLVPYIGSRSKVSEVLAGKRPISMSMARSLHQHLGISAEVLLQEQTASLEESIEDVAYERFPLAQMVKRGWVEKLTPYKDYAEEMVKSLRERAGGPQVGMNALYRRNDQRRINAKTDRYALQAWCWQVLATANENPLSKPYHRGSVDLDFLKEVAKLSSVENGPRLAKDFLAEHGIALITERHLPKTHLDGATLRFADGRPVVGMTLRYDRIDNFWFTLLHELAHVGWHEGLVENEFLDDMSLRNPKGSSDDLIETEADDWAEEALIPKSVWKRSPTHVKPTPMRVVNLASELSIHPAVVAGRVRYEQGNYRLLSQFVGNGEVRGQFEDA